MSSEAFSKHVWFAHMYFVAGVNFTEQHSFEDMGRRGFKIGRTNRQTQTDRTFYGLRLIHCLERNALREERNKSI